MDTSFIPHLRDYAVEYEAVDQLLATRTAQALCDEFADGVAEWDDDVTFDLSDDDA